MTPWYCIRTKRYKERWVAHQLTKVCEEVYVPLLRERRRIRRQLKWVIGPMFPSYLFARFVVEKQFWTVHYTSGVVGLVSAEEGRPVEVDEAIITTLRDRSLNGYIEIKPTPFSPGEELEIIEGPFRGLKALFQREMKAGERVAVLLELLSSWVRVELPRVYVQRMA